MSTIDNPGIIKKMLENNGCYPGDPEPYSIWEYLSGFGTKCYKVIWKSEREETNFLVHGNIVHGHEKCMFEGTRLDPKTGQFTEPKLTEYGKAWLEAQ